MQLTNRSQIPLSSPNIQPRHTRLTPNKNFTSRRIQNQTSLTESRQRTSLEQRSRKLLTNPSPGKYARIIIETKRSNTEQLRYKSPSRKARTPRQGGSISYANQLVTNFRSSISESKLAQRQQQDQNSGKIVCRGLTKRRGQSKEILEEQKKSLARLIQMKRSMGFEKGLVLSQNVIKYKSPSKNKPRTVIKSTMGPLSKIKPRVVEDYIEFIHGQPDQKYTVGFDFNYLRQLNRADAERAIDFQLFKILDSIMLCTDDIYAQCQKDSPTNDRVSLCNLFRQYSLLFFRLFEKNMMQIVLSHHYYKISQTTVTSFFVLVRMYFALQHELALGELITSAPFTDKMRNTLHLIIEITKIMYIGRKQVLEEKSYVAETLKLLKITANIEKKMAVLLPAFKKLCEQTENICRIKQIFEQFTLFQNNTNFQGLDLEYLSQIQIALAWKYFKVPPIPYLPMNAPYCRYTLVLGIHKVLVTYNPTTQIVVYRPYIHTFLTKMREYFEIVAFAYQEKTFSNQLIDCIERNDQYFSYRLCKDHLSFKDGFMSKDLTKLGRQASRVVLIDADDGRQIKQKGVFLLKQFTDDKTDKQLLNVMHHLEWALRSNPSDLTQKLSQYRSSLEHIEEDIEQNYSTIK